MVGFKNSNQLSPPPKNIAPILTCPSLLFFFGLFLSTRDIGSLTRDQTQAPGSENTKS